jgi:hypothetical protein
VPAPTLSHIAQRLYDELAPLAGDDGANGYALAHYCAALALQRDLVADLSRDEDDRPGYAVLLDPDTCPAFALPWLAQFVGVRIPLGMSEAAMRLRIKSTDGFRRGTPEALRGAARQFLTGTQTVFFIERQGTPWRLAVSTWVSETPDPAKVLAALIEQKPAGIVLTYTTVNGGDYESLRGTHASYTTVTAAFATYDALRADPTHP